MKQLIFILFLVAGFAGSSMAQTSAPVAPTDFFAGKWEISIVGTPRGDVKLLTNLVRKSGTLTGELVESGDPNAKMPITKVEESANKLVIYFDSSQAGELALDLTKADGDTLKGSVMNFEATAKRLK